MTENSETTPSVRSCAHPDRKSTEPHPCPFLCDVYSDPDSLCTCCDSCAADCADEI